LDAQLDDYRQRFDAEETIDSPRSEERESRPLKLPVDVEQVEADTLELKPELMQYKSATDAETGRNKTLEGVEKFDEAKAGIIVVWEDVTGRRIVADGHQRVNLLKELQSQGREQHTKLLSRVYREGDGYTAKDVRTIAAEINIAQGTGTALDAAKVLKSLSESAYADVISKMPVNSSLVRDAKGLAKLGDEAFQVVVNELIPPTYGAMVGDAFEESEQAAAMQIMIKSSPDTIAEAHAMIADIQAGGFVESEQGGLFGGVEMESLIKERAAILSHAESKLKKNVSIFNALTKEEKRITETGANVLDTETNIAVATESKSIIERVLRTVNTNPELNNELNRIAKEFKDGNLTKAGAANAFIEAARSYSERSSGEPTARPGVQRTGKAEEKPAAEGQVTEAEGRPVETAEETQVKRLDKRIGVLESVLDCVKA
jgi:hypothetical protein